MLAFVSTAAYLTRTLSGMDRGLVAFATVVGLASKALSRLVNRTDPPPLRNVASSSFPNSVRTVDGEKTSHPATTRTMPRMVCRVMEMTGVV
jgi:hypothetical protein